MNHSDMIIGYDSTISDMISSGAYKLILGIEATYRAVVDLITR